MMRTAAVYTSLFLTVGCGDEPATDAITPPAYVPSTVGQQAITQLDTEQDGRLSKAELQQSPALLQSFNDLDTDGDGYVSGGEIGDRIAFYRSTGTALTQIICILTLNDEPLPGASVTCVPEPFLGSELRPASGVSDDQGNVLLQVEGQPVAGLPYGLYQVQVSLKDDRGIETLPPQFNAATTLGFEVAPGTQGIVAFNLATSDPSP